MIYREAVVEELRARADIVDVVGSYVRLSKKGSSYFGLCPFHGEKTPSFSVSPGKQMFYCFGCHKGGDVIRFVMEYENLSFTEAMEQLAERVGMTLPKEAPDAQQRRAQELRMNLLDINKAAANFFYRNLKSEKGALGYQYLRQRELSDQTIVHFGLGYADQQKDSLYRHLKGLDYEDSLLQQSGLFHFSERGVYDKFFNRVMFPILDVNRRVIGFGGRVMGSGEPKYLNSPETALFDKSRNLYGLNFAKQSRKDHLILCEGYMDVISLHQAGFTQAVASLGTALTQQQAQLMCRYTEKLYLCYDGDGAGIRAARRALPILKEAGISAKIITLAPYKDPDELIKAEGAAAFEQRLEQARNAFLWEVEVEKQGFDLSDPEGRTAYTRRLAEMLCGFTEAIERENYVQAVAREQMLDPEALRRLTNRIGARKYVLGPETAAAAAEAAAATVDSGRRPGSGQWPTSGRMGSPGGHSGPARQSGSAQPYMRGRGLRAGAEAGGTSASPGTQRGREREDALQKSQKQLLTWLAERPEMKALIEPQLKPEELQGELFVEVAKCLYDGNTLHQILDQYREDEERYETVAAMLNERLLPEESTDFDFKKALEDLIRNIKLAALDTEIRKTTDAAALSALFQKKLELSQLRLR